MKKLLTFSFLWVMVVSMSGFNAMADNQSSIFDDIVTVLERNTAQGNLPAIIDDAGATRGSSFNGQYVFVASRQGGGDNVYYWDVMNPDLPPQTLNMTGVTGGTFTLADLTTVGNHIFVSNMTFANGNFKLYHWNGVNAQPTTLIDFPNSPVRLGDAITVVGNPSVEAAIVVTAHGAESVYIWGMQNGQIVDPTPEVYPFPGVSTNFAKVTVALGDDDYVIMSGTFGIALLDDGDIVFQIEQSFFPAWPLHANIFYYEGSRYLAFTHVRLNPNESKLYVLDISDGENVQQALTNLAASTFAEKLVHTVDLGGVSNGNGSVSNDVIIDPYGNLWLYAFSAGNGFVLQRVGDAGPAGLVLPFAENFDGEGEDTTPDWLPEGWLNVDADGDGDTWFWQQRVNDNDEIETYMRSYSWDRVDDEDVPLFPDNWLITPAISLENVVDGEEVELMFHIAQTANNPAFRIERYEVLISDTDASISSFTMLWEETFTAEDGRFEWKERILDLTEFAGGVVYVAFRHFGSSDMDGIALKSVEIRIAEEEPTPDPLIYSISLALEPGEVQYKYFVVIDEPTWSFDEWAGGPDRAVLVEGNITVSDVWGQQPESKSADSYFTKDDTRFVVTFEVDMAAASFTLDGVETSFDPELHKVFIAGSFGGDMNWNEPGSNPDLELTIGDTGVVSVPEVEIEAVSMTIFPNPANAQFSISTSSRLQRVMVSDITGRTISDIPADGFGLTLPTEGMGSGIYMVSVFTVDGVTVQKLQIQK